MDRGNTHLCHCQPGYTGSYCEEQVDECSPNPCQNGATCTDYLGGYSCEVGFPPRLVGSRGCRALGPLSGRQGFNPPPGARLGRCLARRDTGPCLPFPSNTWSRMPRPCLWRAQRRLLVPLQCVAGYHGRNCSEEIKECLSHPCQNGGTCIDLLNTYKCSCPRGTQGKRLTWGEIQSLGQLCSKWAPAEVVQKKKIKPHGCPHHLDFFDPAPTETNSALSLGCGIWLFCRLGEGVGAKMEWGAAS